MHGRDQPSVNVASVAWRRYPGCLWSKFGKSALFRTLDPFFQNHSRLTSIKHRFEHGPRFAKDLAMKKRLGSFASCIDLNRAISDVWKNW